MWRAWVNEKARGESAWSAIRRILAEIGHRRDGKLRHEVERSVIGWRVDADAIHADIRDANRLPLPAAILGRSVLSPYRPDCNQNGQSN